MNGQEAVSQFTAAAIVVYALRYLRSVGWFRRFVSALPMDDASVHRWLSVLSAAATAIGIHTAFDGSLTAGGTLTLTIPPLVVLLHGFWHWAEQFVAQQFLYDVTKPKGPTV